MLQVLLYILIVVVTFFFMEGVAWFTHKYVMHGFLWVLHKDHHQKQPGFFEKNDAFFLIFAIPSFLCLYFGATQHIGWLAAIGTGILIYGIAYFLVHDVIIHQRFKWFTHSQNKYIRVLRWAHKMHHKHLSKEDGESFGMLIVAKKYWDKVARDEEIASANSSNRVN
ncbi:MAG: sterol desaturase family protein [Thermoflavifilum sp.]|nr:sterol desaturase family protein [Thermoflavifilum sp.]